MMVYHGVIKGNTVLLPDDAQLPDGRVVEVSVSTVELTTNPELSAEQQVKEDLLQAGVLSRSARPQPYLPEEDRTPIIVFGEPLTEIASMI